MEIQKEIQIHTFDETSKPLILMYLRIYFKKNSGKYKLLPSDFTRAVLTICEDSGVIMHVVIFKGVSNSNQMGFSEYYVR